MKKLLILLSLLFFSTIVVAQPVTTTVNLEAASPIVGTNATLTNSYAARHLERHFSEVINSKEKSTRVGAAIKTVDDSPLVEPNAKPKEKPKGVVAPAPKPKIK